MAGGHPELAFQSRAWGRVSGCAYEAADAAGGLAGVLRRGPGFAEAPTERAGAIALAGVVEPPPPGGLAARGAEVERGGPAFGFALVDKMELWADDAARLFARATAAQRDPNTAIDWSAPINPVPDRRHFHGAQVQRRS